MNPSNRVYEIIPKPNYLECFRIMERGGFCLERYWNWHILSGDILERGDFFRGNFVRGILKGGDVVRGEFCSEDIVWGNFVWGDIESCFLTEGGGGGGFWLGACPRA